MAHKILPHAVWCRSNYSFTAWDDCNLRCALGQTYPQPIFVAFVFCVGVGLSICGDSISKAEAFAFLLDWKLYALFATNFGVNVIADVLIAMLQQVLRQRRFGAAPSLCDMLRFLSSPGAHVAMQLRASKPKPPAYPEKEDVASSPMAPPAWMAALVISVGFAPFWRIVEDLAASSHIS